VIVVTFWEPPGSREEKPMPAKTLAERPSWLREIDRAPNKSLLRFPPDDSGIPLA
jgi:hypothetical protein